jgi:ABC-type polysaccharide/polyol phosphate export permease
MVLLSRDIRIRYKGSAIGVLWAVVSPGDRRRAAFLFEPCSRWPCRASLFLYFGLWPWTWMARRSTRRR